MINIVVNNIRKGILAIQQYLSTLESISEYDKTPNMSLNDEETLIYADEDTDWHDSDISVTVNPQFSLFDKIKVVFELTNDNSTVVDTIEKTGDIKSSNIMDFGYAYLDRSFFVKCTFIDDNNVDIHINSMVGLVGYRVKIYGIKSDSDVISPIQMNIMDKFVDAVTNGKYKTYKIVIKIYIKLLIKYARVGAVSNFVRYECGVKLNNLDDGSIFGYDRGGSIEVPRTFIFPNTPITTAPSNSFTIEGLTFNTPDAENDIQQFVYDALYSWWAKTALELVKQYYGINFGSPYSLIDHIDVVWDNSEFNPNEVYYASVVPTVNVSDGSVISLKLILPSWYKDYLVPNNNLGTLVFKDYDVVEYVGIIIVHELVHAVIHGNIKWTNYIPFILHEGLANLFVGGDFHTMNGDKPLYVDEVRANSVPVLYFTGFGDLPDPSIYTPSTNFLIWLALCDTMKYDPYKTNVIKGVPFVNKFIYWLIQQDKKNSNPAQVIDSAINYATDNNDNHVESLYELLNGYTDSYNASDGDIDDKLYRIARIQFNNKDCGCYGGSDSLVDDADIPRVFRIYYDSPYEFLLGREVPVGKSNEYFAPYNKDTFEYGGLVVHLPEYTPTTVNTYYKKRIIDRLCNNMLKQILDLIKKLIGLDFKDNSYGKDLYLDFDDENNPEKPMRYYVNFDPSGVAKDYHIVIYVRAYIPEDTSDGMPSKGMYTGNIILYLLALFALLSKLRHANSYYRNPLLIAIAALLAGYDAFAEDVRGVNSEGKIPSAMGGDVDG